MKSVRIVLVEPAGPLNVGSIARVMKNMGLSQLVLVKPHCDPLGEEARQMAVHAADVLEAAQIVDSLPDGLRGCQRAIGTTGRPRADTVLEHPRTALPWLLTDAETALIFGPEDRGLSNDELSYAQRFIGIPANPMYPALNLAQAVAICCYELTQVAEIERPDDRASELVPLRDAVTSEPPASLDVLEGYYQQLEAVLLQIGYLYPHTADSRMKKFRRLFNRALPSETEVAMLRGILSQVEWAMKSKAD
nr:RNA methyltransferase [Leptolyngbya sp. FACHB-36]